MNFVIQNQERGVRRSNERRPWCYQGVLLALLLLPAALSAGTTRTVTTLADGSSGSLRALIAQSASGDTIDFAVTGTITLTNELVINRDLTILGPGPRMLRLDGNGLWRVLHVTGGTNFVAGVTNNQRSGGRGGWRSRRLRVLCWS